MRIAPVLVVLLTASVGHAQYAGAAKVPGDWKKGFDSIRQQDARTLVEFLAGTNFNGRSPDTLDLALAAGAAAQMLRDAGWAPAGDNGSFFHRWQMRDATAQAEGSELAFRDGSRSFRFGTDFRTGAAESGVTEFKIAFVSGAADGDFSAVDFKALKGCYVLATETAWSNPQFRALQSNAYANFGVFGPSRPVADIPSAVVPRVRSVVGSPDPRTNPFPGFIVTHATAKAIAEASGATRFLDASAKEGRVEFSAPLALRIKTSDTVRDHINVVAKLEGTDPILKREAVVLGAHLDHLGDVRGQMHYGADDNASGTSAAIMIARALAQNPKKLKRSVIVGLWTMEEQGTWGSFAYTARPTWPLNQMAAYINMDMLGRNENSGNDIPEFNERAVYPGSTLVNSAELDAVLLANNRFVNLDLRRDKEDRTHRSDTRNFVMHSIPTVKIFTGEHEDYHRPGDVPSKVNYEKLTNIAKWLYLSVVDLGNANGKPRFEVKPFVQPSKVKLAGYATTETALPAGAKLEVVIEHVPANGGAAVAKARAEYDARGARVPFQIEIEREALGASLPARVMIRVVLKGRVIAAADAIEIAVTGWPRARTVALKPVP